MSTLIEELRGWAYASLDERVSDDARRMRWLMGLAAERIDALEKAIAGVADTMHGAGAQHWGACTKARDVLGVTEEDV